MVPRLPVALLVLSVLFPIRALASTLEVPGVPNFHQVNDRIFRGGQPGDEAWGALAKLGVKTVIDLRREVEHSTAAESRMVQAAGMLYVNVPMNGFDTPTAEQMAKLLPLLEREGPVFVHCKQGRDRTGSVIAAYRIARERWTNDAAMAEAQACGLHWFERGMKRFIAGYRVAPEALAQALAATPDSARASVAATP